MYDNRKINICNFIYETISSGMYGVTIRNDFSKYISNEIYEIKIHFINDEKKWFYYGGDIIKIVDILIKLDIKYKKYDR